MQINTSKGLCFEKGGLKETAAGNYTDLWRPIKSFSEKSFLKTPLFTRQKQLSKVTEAFRHLLNRVPFCDPTGILIKSQLVHVTPYRIKKANRNILKLDFYAEAVLKVPKRKNSVKCIFWRIWGKQQSEQAHRKITPAFLGSTWTHQDWMEGKTGIQLSKKFH